VALLQPFELA